MMHTSPPSQERPSLWNPFAAACWSVVFTPAFGAFLHARNADSLGRTDEAKANRVWIGVSLGYLVFTLVGDFIVPVPDGIYRGAAIGLLCGWYFALGRKQIDYVAHELPSGYTRRPWSWPLFIGLIGLIAFFALAFAVPLPVEISTK